MGFTIDTLESLKLHTFFGWGIKRRLKQYGIEPGFSRDGFHPPDGGN
jgi:hypothetical protein